MNIKLLRITLLALLLLALPSRAHADIAPPINPPGSNPQPGVVSTQVRMAAETVLIDVRNDTASGSLGQARVTADFTMHNTGAVDETLSVRFPMSSNDGRGAYPEIHDLGIAVNGSPASYRRASYPDYRYQMEDVPWAEFDVTFPAGQDLPIRVSYLVDGSGYMPFTAFYYILETGAGWKDTIGSADITLRLPYPASAQNVILNWQIGWAETTPGGEISGNELHWHFENFEPGEAGPIRNMEFALVAPSAWNSILAARRAVEASSADSEAWGRLGKLYKGIFFESKGYRDDAGGKELYGLAVSAYEKCLELDPTDAQWHAGFADLLGNRAYWDAWMSGPTPEAYRALEEIRTALELAPDDPVVQEIAQNLTYLFPDGITQTAGGYDFPWLARTPTPNPPTPTVVPVYDPEVLAGTYQSQSISLSDGKTVQLRVDLKTDHSAEMDSIYGNEQPFTSGGSWTDHGDGKIILRAADPVRGPVEIWFDVEGGTLQAYQYPGFYQGSFTLERVVSPTPSPAPTETPAPPPTLVAPTPTTAPRSAPSVCGSAALILLLGGIVLARKRREFNPSAGNRPHPEDHR
ncbi:MAG: tetratricopeptide repeat protein [Bacteroidota bacterium]